MTVLLQPDGREAAFYAAAAKGGVRAAPAGGKLATPVRNGAKRHHREESTVKLTGFVHVRSRRTGVLVSIGAALFAAAGAAGAQPWKPQQQVEITLSYCHVGVYGQRNCGHTQVECAQLVRQLGGSCQQQVGFSAR